MCITEDLRERRLYFEGGMGTMLQSMGLLPGQAPESWNLLYPERITQVHCAYLDAGCDILKANTFGANELRFAHPENLIGAAIQCARAAIGGRPGKYVALDIGPCGKLLEPLGDLPFERAVEVFGRTVRAGVQAGADLILIETMNDAYETKAAVLAAKENSELPVFVTNAYDTTGKLMTGADPAAMVALLEGLRVDALGVNCSVGPDQLVEVVRALAREASVPVIAAPNAGLPDASGGIPVYSIGAEEYAGWMQKLTEAGATVLGGCCGTTPDYLRHTIARTRNLPYTMPEPKAVPRISSYTHAVALDGQPVLIGERINPTGKKRIKEALRAGNLELLLREGVLQAEAGAAVLDVNVGLPEIDEPAVLAELVARLQGVTDLPLQLDTSNPEAMARAMRRYNGKALVNSVNGRAESMDAIFPLVQKYGGAVIALTMDEQGIPETAEGRCAIAEKILHRAAEYGIPAKDVIVDPLAMAVSADPRSAGVTLETIRLIRTRLHGCTSLGVSNISFGLPAREALNSTFFALALGAGLNCAIMNPFSEPMMRVAASFPALSGTDANCAAYIARSAQWTASAPAGTSGTGSSATHTTQQSAIAAQTADFSEQPNHALKTAILRGLKQDAVQEARNLLTKTKPMTLINEQIIPALEEAGRTFEQKITFLPQLLVSAETATAVFEEVKAAMPATQTDAHRKILLATVQGDIHDIGKNIVRVLLESFGFRVIDLGRDVAPQRVCDAAKEQNCHLIGLSALMTTTVPAMEETIRLLRAQVPDARVAVGGAVLTQEYAARIGADHYSADAMETVRYAQQYYADGAELH